MENRILGLHHISAVARDPQRNLDFYSKTLGLRFIKKTVNFDDPKTYHFYYGDQVGSAGTILTFFSSGETVGLGRRGSGMANEIGLSIPTGSLDFWQDRFEEYNVICNKPAEKFGEKYMTFFDPDGLKLELIESKAFDYREPWETHEIQKKVAIRGFHNVTLTLNSIKATARVLTEILGYKFICRQDDRYRYATDAVDTAAIVDLVEVPDEKKSHVAGGTVHHVAFCVENDEILMHFREKIEAFGLSVTSQIDRLYFHSIYFREPGGVLFEIATEKPGFTIDESIQELGQSLKLPAEYESHREQIQSHLAQVI